ncbi:ComEC/Rec2 family competence protein [Rathayibacter caricis]|uniref:ComEC/Rec2 family competence protein n=1 Tax=Rathayibacter caricis TaxID=110936 RepID=UPI001FB217E6|nr:ComEC/Rec2 family competence protein [Rathayibacter caricis]MCJ1694784.1 ComEC/Rec2 family competence protein [Rathayibacter caricis]
MRAADLRLLPVAVLTWTAAALCGLLPASVVLAAGPGILLAAWAAVALLLALLVLLPGRRTLLAVVAVPAAGAALAITAVVLSAPGAHPKPLVEAAERRTRIALEVRVETAARPLATGGVWFDAVALSIDAEEIAAPVRVFLAEPGGRVPVGSELLLEARADGGPRDPVGERTLVTASGILDRSAPTGIAAVAEVLRSSFLERTAVLGGDVAGLLPGLATGDTTALTADLEEDMRTASLTHLTAVSGANCAVVVVAGWLLASLLGVNRLLRTLSALLALAAFVVLVTPEPSVVRAATMATVVLLARLGRRSGAAVPALLASVVLLVIADPAIAGKLGFVLSVLATAGLLLLAEPIARRLGEVLPRPLALVLAVPTAAQLACQPVVLLVDPTVPVYGVLANLLAEPAAPLATGLGLIGCLLAPWWPWGADAAIRFAAVPTWWIASIARAVSSWPMPRLAWWPGLAGVLALTVLTVLALLLLTRTRRLAVLRRTVAAVLAALLAGTAATGVATPLLRSGSVPQDWRVAMCDVGQGDAILLRGDGAVLLVDTGPLPERLDACLSLLGVDRISMLVLTHYDLDHVGGLEAAAHRVDSALVGPSAEIGDERDRSVLRDAGAEVRETERGEEGALGSLRWRVLWPERGSSLRGNAASVTLRVDIGPDSVGGPLSIALLGDLGAEEQGRLARLPIGPVDVVKVAHHGSADQAPALYDALDAGAGLVSVGADNDYGHPAPSLLSLLAERGVEALRSDVEGTVVLASRSDGIAVWASGPTPVPAASGGHGQTVGWRALDRAGDGRTTAWQAEPPRARRRRPRRRRSRSSPGTRRGPPPSS